MDKLLTKLGTPWPVNLRWYKPTLPLIWYRAGILTVTVARNLYFLTIYRLHKKRMTWYIGFDQRR